MANILVGGFSWNMYTFWTVYAGQIQTLVAQVPKFRDVLGASDVVPRWRQGKCSAYGGVQWDFIVT